MRRERTTFRESDGKKTRERKEEKGRGREETVPRLKTEPGLARLVLSSCTFRWGSKRLKLQLVRSERGFSNLYIFDLGSKWEFSLITFFSSKHRM